MSSGGNPALYLAVYGGHAAVVELLLGAGAGVDASTSRGWTPLMAAAQLGYLDIVRLLAAARRGGSRAPEREILIPAGLLVC